MKAKDMMDRNFITVKADESIVNVSKFLEDHKEFTCPVVDDNKKLIGWITALDLTKGLREGKSNVKDVMHPPEETGFLHENDSARDAVLETDKDKVVAIPVFDDNDILTGVISSFDIISTFSDLYETKVSKLYETMQDQLKGVTWDELMQASSIVSRRETGNKITPKEYDENIHKTTFGNAIWATGGLEKFFAGLISVGELVIARKVGNRRK
ncbi:CBS domain-containing protein [Methanobrevibacter sp. 87.7]|uniref:CBS domain-containing protein n=1 Tax=Methanobrevibacter sp. 87.7 TaxID=387957 RepID=UPI000B50CF60|nr:CBS domain-containing protein [Methanobrevibacter sp. 87.7]OWT33522.1 CBS domain-containing protein [Methanobrevibacter sp. 87.7]